MAKLQKTNNKTGVYYRVRLKVNGEVKRVSLGYAKTKREISSFQKIVEFASELETSKAANLRLDLDLQKKVSNYKTKNSKLIKDLVKVGLLEEQKKKVTVKQLFDDYKLLKLKSCKPRTVRTYRTAQQSFEDFIGGDVFISDITAADVTEFIADCKDKGSLDSTIKGYIKRTRQAFGYAVEKEWLFKNPITTNETFDVVKEDSKQAKQLEFVTKENLDQILSFPMAEEWKVLFHLVRFGGLRIAEVLILRWSDVIFDDKDPTITFRGKDTKHNKDRSKMPVRTIPIWLELKEVLEQHHQNRKADDVHVLNNILNLRNKPEFEETKPNGDVIRSGRYETRAFETARKIFERAGVPVWPQLFHAIRDFRINEVSRVPAVTEAMLDSWFGNTTTTRSKHYRATAVSQNDRIAISGTLAGDSIGQILVSENASENPHQRISEAVESGNLEILREIVQFVLKEADSAMLEKIAKVHPRGVETPVVS